MLLGAGAVTVARLLAGSRAREMLGSLEDRLQGTVGLDVGKETEEGHDEDYDEPEAEEDEDFDEDEEFDEEPEAEEDEDFDEDEEFDDEPEAEDEEDFEDEEDDEERRPRARRPARSKQRSRA